MQSLVPIVWVILYVLNGQSLLCFDDLSLHHLATSAIGNYFSLFSYPSQIKLTEGGNVWKPICKGTPVLASKRDGDHARGDIHYIHAFGTILLLV